MSDTHYGACLLQQVVGFLICGVGVPPAVPLRMEQDPSLSHAHIPWMHSLPTSHTLIPHIPRILCPETPGAEKN